MLFNLFPPFPPRPEPVPAPPGSPTQEEAVQNEIDFYESQNQTHHNHHDGSPGDVWF